MSTKFRDLAIGERFHFNRNLESGLLADLDRSGRPAFVKRSSRTYECVESASTHRFQVGELGLVGSIHARVWKAER